MVVYRIEVIIEGERALAISATRNELAYAGLTRDGAESIDTLVRAMVEAGQRTVTADPSTESTELVLDDLPGADDVLNAKVVSDD